MSGTLEPDVRSGFGHHDPSLALLAAAALFGAVGGGIGTYLTTGGRPQAPQAQTEFLRTQRQTAYAKLVGDTDVLLAEAPRFVIALRRRTDRVRRRTPPTR